MKQLLYIAAFTIMFNIQSCGLFDFSKEPMLPEVTMEGAGTFGCLIDDELFLPLGPDATGAMRGNPHAEFTEISGTLKVRAQNLDSWNIFLRCSNVFQASEHSLRSSSVIRDLRLDSCAKYFVDSTSAILTITTFDSQQDIISGLFSGTFINECDSTNSIQITEGRFDLNYTL